jgi:AcrR family transcriptional regulator
MAKQKKKAQGTQALSGKGDEDPSLSRERVAEVAVELLDAQGVRGLTMRRLAELLDCGVMSLYWHVKNKDDVFDLALDSVLAYHSPPDVLGAVDWRADVLHLLEDWRAVMIRHPWAASLLPRRVFGQNILARLELLGTILSSVGVKDEELNAAIWSLWNYVMGATATWASFADSSEERPADPYPEGVHPTIERSGLLQDEDWDGVFRKGLVFLLKGIVPVR